MAKERTPRVPERESRSFVPDVPLLYMVPRSAVLAEVGRQGTLERRPVQELLGKWAGDGWSERDPL